MRSCIKRISAVLTACLILLSLCCFGGVYISHAENETVIVTCLDAAPQYEENGTWYTSSLTGYNGGATRYTANVGASAVFRPTLSKGRYAVSYYRVLNSTSQIASPLTVYHADGQDTFNFNGTVGTEGFVGLSYCNFNDGDEGYVEIVSNNANTNLRTSAVKFEKIEDSYPPSGKTDSAILPEENITVSFYEQILKSSVTENTAKLIDSETQETEQCSVLLSDDLKTLTVSPRYDLKAGHKYNLTLKGITDLYGNEAEELTFTIETILSGWGESGEETDAVGAEIYVSPTGDDENDGTFSNPVASFEKAKELASEKIENTEGNVIVYFRGGTYNMENPVTFTYKDSAPSGQRIIYCAYENERPVFTGEKSVSGWSVYEGDIWKAEIGKGISFRQLYSNDEKLIRSREPDNDESYLLSQEKTDTGFLVEKGVINTNNFKNDMEIAVENVWMHKRLKISSAADAENYTSIAIEENLWNDVLTKPQGSTAYYGKEYHLENSYDFIDEEGEWYFDEAEGILYLKSSGNPENRNIKIPQLESIISIEGSILRPVKNLTFSGLYFRRTNWTYPSEYGLNDIQANTLIPSADEIISDESYRYGFKKEYVKGAVDVKAGVGISVTDCVFSDMGGNAVNFKDGGAHVKINGNTIINCAGGAIEVGDDSYRPSNERMRVYNAEISNNLIRNTGTEYYGSVGILVFYADGVKIEHNDIKNTSYSAINAGWGWGNDEYVETARNYTVKGNRIEDFCMKVKDGGGIYAPNPVYGTSVISENVVIGSANTMRPGTMIGGIYHDAFGSNWTDKDNVLLSVLDWAMGATGEDALRYEGKTIYLENNYVTSHKEKQRLDGEFVEYENTVYLDGTEPFPAEAQTIIDNAGLCAEFKDNFSNLSDLFFAEYGIYEGKQSKSGEIILSLTDESVSVSAKAAGGVKLYDAVKDGNAVKIPFYVYPESVPSVYTVTVTGEKNGAVQTENIEIAVLDTGENAVYVSVADSGYSETGDFKTSGLSGYNGASRYGYSEEAQCSFKAALDEGMYKVYVYRVSEFQSSKNTLIEVKHKYGVMQKSFDFTIEPAEWLYLGTFELDESAEVVMKKSGSGYLRASDVKFEKLSKTVSGADGVAVDTIKSGETVTGKVLLGNYAETSRTYAVYAALYDESGRLLKLERTKAEIASGSETEIEAEIKLPETVAEGCMLKIFVWEETLGNIKAVLNPTVIWG